MSGRFSALQAVRSGSARKLRRAQTSVLENLEKRVLLAAGDLDPTFGSGGAIGLSVADIGAFEVLPDGRILHVGMASDGNLLVERFTAAGQLDSSFGGGDGYEYHNVLGAGTNHYVSALALDGDGGFTVAGRSELFLNVAAGAKGFVARFDAEGARQSGFGNDEQARAFMSSTFSVNRMLIAQDRSILLAGSRNSATSQQFAVMKLSPDGQPVTEFGNSGMIVVADTLGGAADSVQFDAAGRLLASGAVGVRQGDLGSSSYDIAIVRLDATSGDRDISFGSSGVVRYDSGAVESGTVAFPLPTGEITGSAGRLGSNPGVGVVTFAISDSGSLTARTHTLNESQVSANMLWHMSREPYSGSMYVKTSGAAAQWSYSYENDLTLAGTPLLIQDRLTVQSAKLPDGRRWNFRT